MSRLPDAIKRPGRFDEIWKIDPPNDDIRLRVISYLANLEGVSLKDEQAQFLSDIASERSLPGSHLREIVRRISVLGWKEAVSFTEDDLTFSSEWTQNQDPFDALPGSPIKDVKEGRVIGTGVLRKLYKGKGDDECSKGLDPDESERGVLTAQLGYYLDDLED